MTDIGPVRKLSAVVRFTAEEFTSALQLACIHTGLDPTGTDEELQARIDARQAEIFDACKPANLPWTLSESPPADLVPVTTRPGDLYEHLVLMAEILGAFEVPYFGEIKLTQQQLDALRTRCAPEAPPVDQVLNPAAWLTGIPIVLVDTVEESTPYERGWLP